MGITSLQRPPAQAGVGDQPSHASSHPSSKARIHKSTITTKDGTEIFYKDWGKGQPIVFHHGWPLSADDWDNQMMFFLPQGIGSSPTTGARHCRSSQTATGNDMDTYDADVAEQAEKLDLMNAIHVGHSTGSGEVTRYVAQHARGRVAKAAIISAIPPVMVKSEKNPGGTPIEVFDGYRNGLAANRAQLYLDVAAGPFYGFNRPRVESPMMSCQSSTGIWLVTMVEARPWRSSRISRRSRRSGGLRIDRPQSSRIKS